MNIEQINLEAEANHELMMYIKCDIIAAYKNAEDIVAFYLYLKTVDPHGNFPAYLGLDRAVKEELFAKARELMSSKFISRITEEVNEWKEKK